MTQSATLQSPTAEHQIILPRSAVWTIEPSAHTQTIEVIAGTAWLTFDIDHEDHILRNGTTMTLPAHTKAVIQGLPETTIRIAEG